MQQQEAQQDEETSTAPMASVFCRFWNWSKFGINATQTHVILSTNLRKAVLPNFQGLESVEHPFPIGQINPGAPPLALGLGPLPPGPFGPRLHKPPGGACAARDCVPIYAFLSRPSPDPPIWYRRSSISIAYIIGLPAYRLRAQYVSPLQLSLPSLSLEII